MTPLDYQEEAEDTAAVQRALQAERRQTDRKSEKNPEKAMQAGARPYPEPPLPMQTLDKPGLEADMALKPLYDAPYYKGSGKLEGKVALITGGDSGIGRSVAILYAREGADVAIVFLDEHEDAELTRSLVEAEGQSCLLIAGDVSDRAFTRDAVAQTVATLGKLDILVNNAAFQLHAKFEDISEAQFDKTLKTNLYGYFQMAQAAVEHMPYGGAIVNTGSVTGIEGSPTLVDYSMTKGGIHAFTRALSGQLIDRGIRVNAVAPGPVWTPLNPADKRAGQVAQFGAQTAMKRPAQPEELAPAYVFLASAQMSSYITGEILPVIGGYGGA
ncbi:SDR family oxidoreductase [Asticcacaulis sp.]|uniref:SDR family oxidoreductase n=1 Tax=Asticcacaulis sp. TaxID=1872648 RepID=UPI002C29275C|nr:SDR family oxidoreductase [Asticcacaulis sp.]HTM80333.1 SDR family oxidoreductase [Asticcacaulis sp.]